MDLFSDEVLLEVFDFQMKKHATQRHEFVASADIRVPMVANHRAFIITSPDLTTSLYRKKSQDRILLPTIGL